MTATPGPPPSASGGRVPPRLQPTTNLNPPPSTPSVNGSGVSTPREPQGAMASALASPTRVAAHRQSISENLRGIPQSPRARHPSFSQHAFQELLNNPPLPHKGENPWAGRDWQHIRVGEVVDPGEVHWSEWDTSVEDATKLLVESGAPNVVLVRDRPDSLEAVATFDYSDLNAYLLLVVGLSHSAQSDSPHAASFVELASKGRSGEPIPLRDIGEIGRREPLVTLPHTASLAHAVKILGSGVHRIVIYKDGCKDTVGVLSQLRLVRFFWEYGRNFPAIEPLFAQTLSDLGIGTRTVKSMNGDRPLTDALELLDRESITSLPVLDNTHNVVGNISHVDVRLLTKSTSLPLLRSSCIHFISVILSERGMNDGKDSFPVFYVQLWSTLAHTVAKLVATRSHRMWIVDSPSPSGSSAPQTPSATTAHSILPPPASMNPQLSGPPYTGASGSAVSASANPGKNMSGRLNGVVSLTDVLNLIAKASGLDPKDPDEARRLRRRSSSSASARSRPSADMTRSSHDLPRGTGSVSSTSISGRDR